MTNRPCCTVIPPFLILGSFLSLSSATGFKVENGVMWIDPPPEEAEVYLEKAINYKRDITLCQYSDGAIKLEIDPKEMNKSGYDAKMMCENIRCLVETGMSCWD